MPKENRYFMPKHVWHITHRCHKCEFLPGATGYVRQQVDLCTIEAGLYQVKESEYAYKLHFDGKNRRSKRD